MSKKSKEAKEAYWSMVKDVAKFNKKAAKYLRHAPYVLDDFDYDGSLCECFIWADTKQGKDYWDHMRNQLDLK